MSRTPAEILEKVIATIAERGLQHGDYVENMNNTADLMSSFLAPRLEGSQAAVSLALLKISRMTCGGYNSDDFEDAVGYLAIAAALAEAEAERSGGPERTLRVLR